MQKLKKILAWIAVLLPPVMCLLAVILIVLVKGGWKDLLEAAIAFAIGIPIIIFFCWGTEYLKKNKS